MAGHSNTNLSVGSPPPKTIILSVILIIILGFGVYANTFNNQFIWDDDVLVVKNPYIKSWSGIENIFTEDVGAGSGREYYFYRPVSMMTYMIDYSLWKLDPKGYHLANLAWHVMAALALYWFIFLLFKDQFLSIITSIFFVVHPVHTEVVTYISGRSDAILLFFILLSFIFYIKHLHQPRLKLYLGMVACYTAAVFSRENGLILPALLLMYHYTFKERINLKGFLSIVGIAGGYILLRVTFLKHILSEMPQGAPLLERLPGVFVAMTNYARLLVLPFDLHMGYGQGVFSPLEPEVFMGMAILLLITYVLRRYRCNRVILFSALWFFISILPVSNIFPLNAYMAEHWLYLPSVGFFLVLAEGARLLYHRESIRKVVVIFLAGLLGFYAFQTVRQNAFYREPISFYERTLHYASDSYKMQHNLGLVYYERGNYEEAIEFYQEAIALRPDSAILRYHLGAAYSAIGQNEAAITAFQRALMLDAKFAPAYYNLGNIYSSMGEKRKAVSAFRMAIRFDPRHVDAYTNLGAAYIDMGRKEEAVSAYMKVIELNPDSADAYNNLAVVCDNTGQIQRAIDLFKKAIEIDPDHAAARANLSKIYSKIEAGKVSQ